MVQLLDVWVDLTCSPSGRFIMSGDVVGLMLVTGVPGSTKCPVAPTSAMAMSMATFILLVLKIVSACSYCAMLRLWKVCFHTLALVANGSVVL